MTVRGGARWNHSIHYHPRVLGAVPEGAKDALDVGCGEGMLARRLRRTVPHVVGIDQHGPSLDEARRYDHDVEYVHGDFLTHPFEPESFDVITSVATLHHLDAVAALTRMRELLRPGGTLAVIGLARRTARDLPVDIAGTVVGLVHRGVRGYWNGPSPTATPPPLTYADMRTLAAETLPGAQFRRHLLRRYSLLWTKPHAEPDQE